MDHILLHEAYRTMLQIRITEEKIADLVEAKEIHCPCHLYIGQEAIAAGVCATLDRDDTLWGGHRSHGHYLAKGGDLRAMMAEIFGRETGCAGGRGGSMHLVAPDVGIFGTVPLVAATIPLAVGAGLASKLNGTRQVAVSFFGDGATEEGHFHESVNLAAVLKLPVVFVCENNFYASHMALLERRAQDNIEKTGAAHGIPGVRVDGNDIEAVYEVSRRAVEHARNGEGPSLIEARTFRWRGHVGPSWDMDVGVKRKDELQDWLKRDPVANTRRKLEAADTSTVDLDKLEQELRAEIDDAVAFARSSASPHPDELAQHVFVGDGEAR